MRKRTENKAQTLPQGVFVRAVRIVLDSQDTGLVPVLKASFLANLTNQQEEANRAFSHAKAWLENNQNFPTAFLVEGICKRQALARAVEELENIDDTEVQAALSRILLGLRGQISHAPNCSCEELFERLTTLVDCEILCRN